MADGILDVVSVPFVDPAVKDDPGIYPPPAVLSHLVPERAKSMQFMRELTAAWTAFKTGT